MFFSEEFLIYLQRPFMISLKFLHDIQVAKIPHQIRLYFKHMQILSNCFVIHEGKDAHSIQTFISFWAHLLNALLVQVLHI